MILRLGEIDRSNNETAGCGFAVVAEKVRALAQRTATSAKEIRELIFQSPARVSQGAALTDSVGGAMEEVQMYIRRLAEIVSEIAAASKE